jgi:hypothetical protein
MRLLRAFLVSACLQAGLRNYNGGLMESADYPANFFSLSKKFKLEA